MANYFSRLFSDSDTATSATERFVTSVNKNHGRIRVKSMEFKVAASTWDVAGDPRDTIKMGTFRSSDCIHALFLTSDDIDTNGSPTAAAHIGLAKEAHTFDLETSAGIHSDRDLIASGVLVGAAVAHTDVLGESGTVTPALRGRPLWELAAAGTIRDDAGVALTKDPAIEYALIIAPSAVQATAAAGTIKLTAFYTSGD